MATNDIKKMVGKVFDDIADAIETGQFGEKVKVGITTLGSELGIDNVVKGAELAAKRDNSIEVVLIGPKVESDLTQVVVEDEDAGYKRWKKCLIAVKSEPVLLCIIVFQWCLYCR